MMMMKIDINGQSAARRMSSDSSGDGDRLSSKKKMKTLISCCGPPWKLQSLAPPMRRQLSCRRLQLVAIWPHRQCQVRQRGYLQRLHQKSVHARSRAHGAVLAEDVAREGVDGHAAAGGGVGGLPLADALGELDATHHWHLKKWRVMSLEMRFVWGGGGGRVGSNASCGRGGVETGGSAQNVTRCVTGH